MEYPLIVPAEIDPKTSLEELQAIKNAWVRFARDNEFPKTFWTIVKWLGENECSKHSNRESRVFRTVSGVEVYGHEETVRFNPGADAFEYLRTIHVWATVEKGEHKLVACWQWRICGSNVEETKEKLLFVTGMWVDVLLSHAKSAYDYERGALAVSVEHERKMALAELLAGVSL